MSGQLAAVHAISVHRAARPVYRSIVAVDLEGSTKRTNLVKGELRRVMYELLHLALKTAGIGSRHLDHLVDRGDGVLILIRPHDDVPKTLVLGRLIPTLAALLAEHNAAVNQPELQIRLRAVVHAGEIHDDGKGFYGDDLDVAFRLLDAPTVKRVLKEAAGSPLVLVVSEEIFSGIVRHGYVSEGPYGPVIRVRVGERHRRGWVHIPIPADSDRVAMTRGAKGQLILPTPLSIAVSERADSDKPQSRHQVLNVNGREAPLPERGSPGAGRR
jgi:hypothetical protein